MTLGSRWGYFYREEVSDELNLADRTPGKVRDGAFFLAPPFVELTLADGLWATVNRQLGTLFDFAEEEVIDPDAGKRMATVLSKFAQDHYAEIDGIVRKEIGTHNGAPVFAEMPLAVLTDVLKRLGTFISDEAVAGHTIVGAL